jgi:hypothetical protein
VVLVVAFRNRLSVIPLILLLDTDHHLGGTGLLTGDSVIYTLADTPLRGAATKKVKRL